MSDWGPFTYDHLEEIRFETPRFGDILAQTEYWWYKLPDGQRARTRLDDMTNSHVRNLYAWLLRRARSIRDGVLDEIMRSIPSAPSDGVADLAREIEGELDGDPVAWLNDQPLVRELARRIETLNQMESIEPKIEHETFVEVLERIVTAQLTHVDVGQLIHDLSGPTMVYRYALRSPMPGSEKRRKNAERKIRRIVILHITGRSKILRAEELGKVLQKITRNQARDERATRRMKKNSS